MRYKINQYILLAIRKYYLFFIRPKDNLLECENNINQASEIISFFIKRDLPCMITRFGAVELNALINYYDISLKHQSFSDYIMGKQAEWWWNDGIKRCMKDNAGFFPNNEDSLLKFGELMLNDIKLIDVLGSWQPKEQRLAKFFPNAKLIKLLLFDPFWAEIPWTKHLEGLNVLVVHPFNGEIEYQYKRRELLFENSMILPKFNLKTIKAVQSIGGNCEFKDWFQALEYMKSEINKVEFDVCLLGCGAYGLPLAAHIKRIGKKAIHIGGSLQLFFGIKGKRWENPMYGKEYFGTEGVYSKLFNDYWIRAGQQSQIVNSEKVDDNCYW